MKSIGFNKNESHEGKGQGVVDEDPDKQESEVMESSLIGTDP